jgi:hypothetical protein
MERAEFVAIVEPLRIAMRAEMDQPTWTAYYRAMQDVPVPLLVAAVETLMREDRQFFPKAGEIRGQCERERKAIIDANPYTGCEACAGTGWTEIVCSECQTRRVKACSCREDYKSRLVSLGVGKPLQLTAPREDSAFDGRMAQVGSE